MKLGKITIGEKTKVTTSAGLVISLVIAVWKFAGYIGEWRHEERRHFSEVTNQIAEVRSAQTEMRVQFSDKLSTAWFIEDQQNWKDRMAEHNSSVHFVNPNEVVSMRRNNSQPRN